MKHYDVFSLAWEAKFPVDSLDEVVGDPEYAVTRGDLTPSATPPPDGQAIARVDVEKLLRELSPREQAVLALRFGIGLELTLDDCGSAFGCSRQNVYLIERKALARLKKSAGGA